MRTCIGRRLRFYSSQVARSSLANATFADVS